MPKHGDRDDQREERNGIVGPALGQDLADQVIGDEIVAPGAASLLAERHRSIPVRTEAAGRSPAASVDAIGAVYCAAACRAFRSQQVSGLRSAFVVGLLERVDLGLRGSGRLAALQQELDDRVHVARLACAARSSPPRRTSPDLQLVAIDLLAAAGGDQEDLALLAGVADRRRRAVASPSQKSMMPQISGFCCSMVVVTLREVVASQFESGLATTLKSGCFASTFMMPAYW